MGPGRRDFDELAAKLEKHIDRLPDYAQRAQEKLQRYLPSEQAGQRAPNPLRRPAPPRPSFTSVPVFAEARSKWERWNAPAAKLERRKRRASRAVTLWLLLTLLCGLFAVAGGLHFIVVGSSSEYLAVAGAVVFATLGVRSGLRLRQLNRTELPAADAARPPKLPSPKSAARAPMERLTEGEESLAELLRQLSAPSSLVGGESVEDARKTAAEAATALRALAERIQAIERARDSAPAADRKALESAVRNLLEQLNEGLDDYATLIAAAGRAVAAGSTGMAQSKEALTDATDRLAGLAIALREVS
ncbi:hypothetical protein FPZ12_033605 [Amycolatopsis acidicola]|uniref:Uncharacterized protein n=1 Tax=Amycolatopsis acidicola TaxID=2596893 RepID=A0A5N0US64_9PSEU|nr:hypothetical protein [Amycolatopsis acidicola]KAA9153785.1 hypothetical protein FPZ12_033605 [Amycolatopsis acidicola]